MLDIFKLEKLKIEGFSKPERSGEVDVFEAMFNPTSIHRSHEIAWSNPAVSNASASELTYSASRPEILRLDLTLDGTGVNELAVLDQRVRVLDRIEQLKKVAYTYKGDIHEPRYLCVSWGKALQFNCRLQTLDITYSLFDRDGSPLRAELTLTLIADKALEVIAKEENKQSPDITHARIVRAGDTLPLLTSAMYGSPDRYLDVARFNELDDFRDLTPGQELRFPPIAEFDAKPSAEG